jgi:hypothetical protein
MAPASRLSTFSLPMHNVSDRTHKFSRADPDLRAGDNGEM